MTMTIMKKLLALLCVVLVAVSCSDNIDSSINVDYGEGAVRLGVVTRTAESSAIDADTPVVIKIYKVEDEEQQLIRRYTSVNDVPETLALLAGNYVAKVQVGDKQAVSFDNKYYYGEAEFAVEAGIVTPVTVDCKLLSTVVSVAYDASVTEKLSEGYFTTVAIAESYDADAIESGDVLSLKYTESKDGYVIMPEGQTSLYWHFEGTHPEEGDIVKEGLIENIKPAAKYTITFKYSQDAPGNLVFEATVDESVEEYDDTIIFSPDPVVLGDGFDMTEMQLSTTASRKYNVTSLAAIKTMNVTIDGVEYNLLAEAPAGITVAKIDDMTYTVTVANSFFNGVTGGKQSLSFYIEDVDGGTLKDKAIEYNVQGITPLSAEDYSLWFGTATFKANVVNTAASSVKIAYSTDGTSWTEVAAVVAGDGIYKADIADFACAKNYSYKLIVDGVEYGKSLQLATSAGAQIPNGDMERWHKSTWWLPYGQSDAPFWLTGNEGGNMAGAILTQPSDSEDDDKDKEKEFAANDDIRPGSTGSRYAYLKSQKATVMGIGKFAAGNLFTGTFAMNGLDGIVTFGRDFAFTAKPKSMSFWMKNNEGTINEGSHATGTDKYTAMILITDGTTYAVNTKDENTFIQITKDGMESLDGVIGYGFLTGTDSRSEWTEETIEITYREDMKNVKPKKIVVSFTPSGYGDYFCGSTSSWMYVDDIVLNY